MIPHPHNLNWNWKLYNRTLFIFPYPYVIFIIISKGIFSHDEEKIVAFCLIAFAIILYYSVNEVLIQIFEERSRTIAADIREVVQARRSILPKMRRFLRLFMDLEDAIAHTCYLLFFRIIKSLKSKNENRATFIQHLIKNRLNELISIKIQNKNLIKEVLLNTTLYYTQTNIQHSKTSASFLDLSLNTTNSVNTLHYLVLNK